MVHLHHSHHHRIWRIYTYYLHRPAACLYYIYFRSGIKFISCSCFDRVLENENWGNSISYYSLSIERTEKTLRLVSRSAS